MSRNALIIGAGIGGIATSVRLALKGIEVSVIEKNSKPGGKISEINAKGYRFDTGPSVFTLPELVDELFELADEKPEDFYQYRKLDESARYFYEDGLIIDAYADPEDFIKEMSKKTGEDPLNIRDFLKKSEIIYNATSGAFVFNSIHDRSNLLSKSSLKALRNFYKIDAFTTMHASNKKRFNTQRVTQFFDRYATYNGSNPYKVPGTLNIIPHLEHNLGAFFPEKGMYSIIRALLSLAEKVGVKFYFNTEVNSILSKKRKIEKVVTDNGTFHTNYVISNMDINLFYNDVMPDKRKLDKVLKHEKSSSALIFYWGVKKEFPVLKLHNILFSENYSKEFEHLFQLKSVYQDPTVYIFISSKNDKDDAPAGKENWYVMINAPENVGQDWHKEVKKARKTIVEKIKRTLKIDIEQYIEFEEVTDPVKIEKNTGSYHGSLYGNSSNSMFSAFNRHPNFSKKIKGLYFTGGSVHPGGGIPLCLASAKIVSDKIKP